VSAPRLDPASADPVLPAPPLAVDGEPREVLLAELAALGATLRDPEARERNAALEAAVESGAVEPALLGRLESLLEMLLQTGRARRLYGPEAERALLRLFHQTARGGAARRATEAVNAALAGLAGQVLHGMLFTVQGPGTYRLGLATERCRLTLEIDRHGLSVESLEV
jgi:hypothetical protein